MKGFSKATRLLVCVMLIASLLLSFASCKKDTEAGYESKLSALLYEKQKLLNERESLGLWFKEGLGNTSFMSLAFVSLDSALYLEVVPKMVSGYEGAVELVGVLALSRDELPGLEGKITLEEYRSLILRGWGCALYWDGEGELVDFITQMQSLLSALDIELPKSIMFAAGAYSEEYDDTLLSYGIENAIHGEGGRLELVEKTAPDGVWHPGYIGWKRSGSKGFKEGIENDCGYALFEIDFDSSVDKQDSSYFPVGDSDSDRLDAFDRMLEFFRQSAIAGTLEVCDVDYARAEMSAYYARRAAAEAESALRLEEIEAELADVQRRITELYNQYF